MYESSITYHRTPEERADQSLSWKRTDKAFFAAGACHILAFTFKGLHPDRNIKIIFIRAKSNGSKAAHVYVLDGEWAFDFNGWTKEKELLEVTESEHKKRHSPDWDYDRIIIKEDLETFCKNNNHRLPTDFAHLPLERARNYIKQFSNTPPKS